MEHIGIDPDRRTRMRRTVGRLAACVIGTVVGAGLGALIRSIDSVGWFFVDGPLLGGLLGLVAATSVLLVDVARRAVRERTRRGWTLYVLLETLLSVYLPAITFLGFMIFGPETVCLWDPLRDTRLSSPRILEQFQSVRVGMSMADVDATFGEPMSRANGIWRYSSDGACQDCDRAWLMLGLRFEDGRVSRIYQQWELD